MATVAKSPTRNIVDHVSVEHNDDGTHGAVTAQSVAFPASTATAPTTGMYVASSDSLLSLNVGGTRRFMFSSGDLQVSAGTASISLLGATALVNLGNPTDVSIARGGTNGALRILNGTTPTGTNCGAGATFTGNNSCGSVTLGAAPGTPVITFNGTWTNAPRVFLNEEILATATTTTRATSIGTTSFTITSTAALAAGDKISWLAFSS